MRQRRRRDAGFTLTELAVVMAVVALLLGMGMYTLGAQLEQRNRTDSERRLEEARELLYGFAVVNGRLPCPARYASDADHSGGLESFCTNDSNVAACGAVTTAPSAHGRCSNPYDGFLPSVTLGAQPLDAQRFAVDAWGNRIRYALSATTWGTQAGAGTFARFSKRHASGNPDAAWGVGQTPGDLVVCTASPALAAQLTCDAGTAVTNQNAIAAIVYSTGKNGPTPASGAGANEARNLDANALFVYRPPDPAGAGGGEFDDHMAWVPVGVLYSRMVAAGVLP